MGWAIGYSYEHQRDIGYGVPATCDHPDCNETIDRGLGYVCGGDVCGGDHGCGLFFCGSHLAYYNRGTDDKHDWSPQLCETCGELFTDEDAQVTHFTPKPDIQEWIDWKLTDESWESWRQENPDFVEKHGNKKEIA